MSWFEFFATIVPSISWPISLVATAAILKSALPELLPRLHKIGPAGMELYPHLPEQKRRKEVENTDLTKLELDPLQDPVADKIEKGLLVELNNLKEDAREATLIRALTNAQMARSFALAYSNIFGSQILTLERLNTSEIPRDKAQEMFIELQRSEPIFKDWSLDHYLQFLFAWQFIDGDESKFWITPTGRNFLQFIIYAGLSKERLY